MPDVPPPQAPPPPQDDESGGEDGGDEEERIIEIEFSQDEDDEEEEEEEEDDDEDDEERPQIPSTIEDDEEISKCSDVGGVLKIWDERIQAQTSSGNNTAYNPVKILTRLSEIIEFETLEYLKLDPDPFDDRHPTRTHPDCALGHSLKALFKKEVFMNKLVLEYLKENWGEGLDLDVNTAASRLFVNVLPGLETSVIYQETEGLILKLFTWAENSPEPLKSYSLGLLGASMEVPEIAGKFKEKNIHLVQIMLQRLKDLQTDFFATSLNGKIPLSRPFQQFSSNEVKSGNTESSSANGVVIDPIADEIVSIATGEKIPNGNHSVDDTANGNMTSDSGFVGTPPPAHRRASASATEESSPVTMIRTLSTPAGSAVLTPRSSRKPKSTTSAQKHFLEPTSANRTKRRKLDTSVVDIDETSTSSSWAELEPNIIGMWQVYPVNLVTRQIFTLRYLTPLGEYQEMLSYAFELNAIQIILKYLSKSYQTKETSRLTFEALKYLGALLCHKKFALEFLQAGGLQKLLQVARPSLSATGVSLCLYYIAYCEDAMEKVCLMSRSTLQNLISYVLWLLECAHNSGRNHALMFFSVIYPFKNMLDLFDSQDGLRGVLNVITMQPSFIQMKRSIDGRQGQSTDPNSTLADLNDSVEDLSDEDLMISRQSVRQVSFNLKKYFECHLAFTADKLRRTIGKNQNSQQHLPGPILPPYKALKPFTAMELMGLHNTVQDLLPENAQRWAPVDRFLTQNGLETIMQTIAMAFEWNYAGRGETVKNMLDVLAVACLIPRTQLMLIERYKINGTTEHSGMSIVLSAAEGEIVNEPEVKKSALQVIGNCVCSPMHHKRPSDIQTKIWECVRINNGILILTRLLQTKSPITDADSIRAMACWCLSGLARYRHVRQVLQQLPLIRAGLIQNLMTEPILQDKRQDHTMFQKYAMEIIKLVHGKEDSFTLDFNDVIRKSDLISQSKVDYYGNDLTELIYDHLVKAGLAESAAILQMEAKSKHNYNIQNAASTAPINLDKIVRQYLLNQHSLCKTPMITCPTFELLKPHKCPSKSDRPRAADFKSVATPNFGSRFFRRQMGAYSQAHSDRKLIYSKYKPFRVLRSVDVPSDEEFSFTSCAFSPCYQWTIVGTNTGEIKLFNNSTQQEDGTYTCHDSDIYHVQPNNKCSLLLTSNLWRRPLSCLWKMEGLFDKVIEFEREEYVEFSKLTQDKVIATNSDTATIYDIETKSKLLTLKPRMSNAYSKNRATFDPYDELILSDGVLWDFKSGKEVHKFDKLNENLNGVFNPKNGIEIISNTEIWDVRTFHLLKTVRQLDQCQLTFTNDGNIIYGMKVEREQILADGSSGYKVGDTSFVVLDNLDDYSSIATIELKRNIMALAVAPNDLQLALVENHAPSDETFPATESCVRFYEIGRSRASDLSADGLEDEDDVQSDDEEEVEESDDDDDDEMGDEDESNDEEEDDGEGDNDDLDRLLDHLLEPNRQMFINDDDDDEGDQQDEDDSSDASWDYTTEEDGEG